MSMMIISRLKINKGVQNLFDLSCFEHEEDMKRKVIVKTHENSNFEVPEKDRPD